MRFKPNNAVGAKKRDCKTAPRLKRARVVGKYSFSSVPPERSVKIQDSERRILRPADQPRLTKGEAGFCKGLREHALRSKLIVLPAQVDSTGSAGELLFGSYPSVRVYSPYPTLEFSPKALIK